MRPQIAAEHPRVVASIPFVEQLARRVAATMPHSIDIGDLVQDVVIGLIDAAHRFDESRGIKFETFAERRIRGAMIDALRKDPGRAASAASGASSRPRARRCVASWAANHRLPILPRAWAPTRSASAARSSASTPSNPRLPLPNDRWTNRPCRPRSCPQSLSGRTRRMSASRRSHACAPPSRSAAEARAEGDRPLLLRRSHDEADRRRDRRERIPRFSVTRARHSPPA